jgi:hypothetical protein
VNEALTGSVDLGLVGAVLPARAESGVNQAVSPGRIKSHRIGIHTGNLAACDEAIARWVFFCFLRTPPGIVAKKNSLVLERSGLEEFSS